MQDYTERLTISISGKTHSAMIAFLKKHGADSHDISRFIEDAITWRIMDRELAFHHADREADVELFRDEGDGEREARLSA
jgi:hypothetical protein